MPVVVSDCWPILKQPLTMCACPALHLPYLEPTPRAGGSARIHAVIRGLASLPRPLLLDIHAHFTRIKPRTIPELCKVQISASSWALLALALALYTQPSYTYGTNIKHLQRAVKSRRSSRAAPPGCLPPSEGLQAVAKQTASNALLTATAFLHGRLAFFR